MRRHSVPRVSTGVAVVATVVAVLAAVGIAYASIPDSNGVIHGCYSPKGAEGNGGTGLNIVDSDSATCNRGQQEVTWNQMGPQGPSGPQGPEGPPGPSAPAFTTRTVFPAKLPLVTPQSFAHLTLPAGNYVINASAWFGYESGTHDAPVFCRFYVEGNDAAQIVFSMRPNTATSGSLTLATDHLLRTGGRVDLSCFVNSIFEDTVVMINEVQLNAIQVGALTNQ